MLAVSGLVRLRTKKPPDAYSARAAGKSVSMSGQTKRTTIFGALSWTLHQQRIRGADDDEPRIAVLPAAVPPSVRHAVALKA